ncbi:LytTR family DNA-binding domain-containing protein [Ferrimonas balearica]|uniref:LytTR family DNA-binding domain-containing protein n=1 Tax=Ferrimonas balearica TaxID=44012 RepID=UPI001C584E95|nr:LytTR family DNA-binding domain-containing protein [Ferrimonas balearica]MBW3138946.1 LytTR family transcriptional regulator [Ferrimonas balearica]MBW3163462.1 LytTR family transcriptional regulator [Ferrimonas balearica]MBY6106008.1 LytTR family transcriptional regulator [Ferrimonas balearica]MBY6223411.1 LytTR family transcriptional regulator [Ferrimonas balearica]
MTDRTITPLNAPGRTAPSSWQTLVEALPQLMLDRELDKQLATLSALFAQCFPGSYVDWHWRGRRYANLHPACEEQFRLSCNNLLSGRVYAERRVDEAVEAEQKAWIKACGDVITSHGRTQLSRADFNALSDIRVALPEAAYIQAANQYVELFDEQDNSQLFRVNLHQVEAMFGDVVIRVHRSYLVNAAAVTAVERKRNGRFVLKIGETVIPIGDSHLDAVRERHPGWFSQRPNPRPLQSWLYPKGDENGVKLTG